MKKRNKFLAMLLAMTMCGTALAGCGSDTKPSESTTVVSTETVESAETTVATEPVATEPLKNVDIYPLQSDKTFTVVSSSSIFGDNGFSVVTKAMEKATGVSIDWQTMTNEQFKLALSGGEYPDAVFYFSKSLDKAAVYEYGSADYFVNFMDYLDIMPNFSALIEEYPECLEAVQNEDGSVYTLPRFLVTNTASNNLLYYRTDMMEEIGWKKAPATTDEFLQYIKDLQAHYGAIDPEFIAFNAYAGSHMGWSATRLMNFFFPAFGELVKTDLTVDSKDKVVLGAATEQYKHLLEFMNEVWNSGAFNTNIYTQDATASQALAAGNHVAVSTMHNGHSLANFDSEVYEMDILAPLTSEYWDTPQWYKAPSVNISNINMISTKCEDIETMVKWMDAWYAPADNPLNEEGTLYAITPWLGEIGVDFVLDDDTMIYTEQEHEGIETGKFLATQSFGGCLYSGFEDGLFPYSQPPTSGVGVKGRGTTNNLWPYSVQPFDLNTITLSQDERDIYNDLWADINTYIDEMTAKFITGELNIEQEWGVYLSYLEKMELQKVIDIYQVAYDHHKAK